MTVTSPMASRPLYDIGPFWSSERNTNCQMTVYVADKHFQIDLSTANFKDSPAVLNEYLSHLRRLDPEYIPEDLDEFDDPLEEMYDWALDRFLSHFRKIPPLDAKRKYTLQDCLFPETLHYTLRAVNGKLSPLSLSRYQPRASPCGRPFTTVRACRLRDVSCLSSR